MITVSERHDTTTSPPLAASMIHNRSSLDDPDSSDDVTDDVTVTSVEVVFGRLSVSVPALSVHVNHLEVTTSVKIQ